jgi:hypothetical protein
LIIFVPENSAVEASVVILILMLLAVGKYWRKTFFFFVNFLSKKIPHIIFQRKFKIIDTVPKNVFIIKTKVLLPQAYVTLAEFGYSA